MDIKYPGFSKLHVAIISARRPEQVEPTLAFFDHPERVWWYVSIGDRASYEAAGASNVVEVGVYGKPHMQRNAALEHAFSNKMAVHCMSDDLKWLRFAPTKSRDDWYDITADQGMRVLYDALKETKARIAGISPTDNPFFVTGDLNPKGFLLGDFYMVAPSKPRFRREAWFKDDYDITLQHLVTYGMVARCDRVLSSFNHANKTGGLVGVRDQKNTERAIQQLLADYPGAVRRHATREGEITLQWPPKKGSPLRAQMEEKGLV